MAASAKVYHDLNSLAQKTRATFKDAEKQKRAAEKKKAPNLSSGLF
jgi:hypothetical protein